MTETYTEQLARVKGEIAKCNKADRGTIAMYATELRENIDDDSKWIGAIVLVAAELAAAIEVEAEAAGGR